MSYVYAHVFVISAGVSAAKPNGTRSKPAATRGPGWYRPCGPRRSDFTWLGANVGRVSFPSAPLLPQGPSRAAETYFVLVSKRDTGQGTRPAPPHASQPFTRNRQFLHGIIGRVCRKYPSNLAHLRIFNFAVSNNRTPLSRSVQQRRRSRRKARHSSQIPARNDGSRRALRAKRGRRPHLTYIREPNHLISIKRQPFSEGP